MAVGVVVMVVVVMVVVVLSSDEMASVCWTVVEVTIPSPICYLHDFMRLYKFYVFYV